MTEDLAAQAFARIDAALQRIEAAGDGNANGAAAAEFSHLATRHDALRDEVRGALASLEALLAKAAA